MLSKNNRDKLCLTGLYKCKPDKKYRSKIYWDNLYWCMNWTFKVNINKDDKVFMVDTYFNDNYIELTDNNFDEFQLIFDFNDVISHSGKNIDDYNESDYWCLRVDSGGMYCGGKYFLRKDAKKNRQKLLERLNDETEEAKRHLEYVERKYQSALNE